MVINIMHSLKKYHLTFDIKINRAKLLSIVLKTIDDTFLEFFRI